MPVAPGQARRGRDGPGQSWLYGFSASDCRERAQKRRKDTEQKQEGTTVVGPLALVRATLVRPWEIYDQEVLALALAVALENANRMWRHQSSAHLLCRR